MDILSHVFLPLILLAAIGRLKAKYTPLALLSILPDFDKLFFLGILHSVVTTAPAFAVLFYLERRIKHGYEISVISSYFFFSHLFLDFLDGFVPAALSDFKDRSWNCFPGKSFHRKLIGYCGRYFSSARFQRAKAVELLRSLFRLRICFHDLLSPNPCIEERVKSLP